MAGDAKRIENVRVHKKLQPMAVIGYFLMPSSRPDDLQALDRLRESEIEEVLADAEHYGDIGV